MKQNIVMGFLVSLWVCGAVLGADLSAATAPAGARQFALVTLDNPRSVAVDRAGNLYVVDVDSAKVRKISLTGEVTAIGGSAIQAPLGVAAADDGAIYIAEADSGVVHRVAPDGTVTAIGADAAKAFYDSPISVAVDAGGNAFVANNGNSTIVKVTPEGAASVFAGKAGAVGGTDGPAAEARFASPRGIAVDGQGNLYVADEGNSNIRKITPDGVVSTLAGTAGQTGFVDGDGAAAKFSEPRGLAAGADGVVYVADTGNHCIRKITAAGVVTTLAGQAGQSGNIDGEAKAARFNEPRGVAVDAAGNVLVADAGNHCVRQITPEGVVTTVAASVAPVAAPTTATSSVPLVPPGTGETEKLDYTHAQTLDGWDGDPQYWSVKDGTFTAKGEKNPSTFLLTSKNYSDFRLTFSSQVISSENHAGIAFWGDRTISTNGKNKWAFKGPLLMFPGLGLWSYVTNKNIPFDSSSKALAKKIFGQHDLVQVEMLAQGNRLRVAYNGQQVLDWREDPSLLKAGPVGLQFHGFSKAQEVIYKDVVIEAFPKEDRLLTVK